MLGLNKALVNKQIKCTYLHFVAGLGSEHPASRWQAAVTDDLHPQTNVSVDGLIPWVLSQEHLHHRLTQHEEHPHVTGRSPVSISARNLFSDHLKYNR